jgi:hypothetical protein
LPDVKTIIKKDEFSREKECIEKCVVKVLWKHFMGKDKIDINSLPQWEMFDMEEDLTDGLNDNFKIPE